MKFKILRVQTLGEKEYNDTLIKHFSEEGIEFAIIGGAVYANTSSYLDQSEESPFRFYGPMMSIFHFNTEEWNNGACWEYIFEQRNNINNFYTLCEIIADRRTNGEMVFYRTSKSPEEEPAEVEVTEEAAESEPSIADWFKSKTSITK